MTSNDHGDALAQQVAAAADSGTPLRIRGQGSKDFLGRTPSGDVLDLSAHSGIINYEPTELVLTARAGTPLSELEAALSGSGQMMPFEPPHFGDASTIGGTIAAGLSGPRRPWAGSARDLILGVRLINGQGENMRFGGEVIKNVAGYDVSRLATGSYGTLGVILDISMKVLPLPEAEVSLRLDHGETEGFNAVEQAFRAGVPVSGAAHDGKQLRVRLSGTKLAVDAGIKHLGGEQDDDPATFWHALRDHRLPVFTDDGPALWRLSLPPMADIPDLPGQRLADWGGQQHWLRTDASPEHVFSEAARLGGHATCFHGGDRDGDVFHPLSPGLRRLHERVKTAFDPKGILNPGRLYAGI
ncbi:glycolate oxidase subunit GlcE [Aquisalimonas asiatica]|uniref:Glycolate oxidase FAD binding subunit n=1 Tax=Aquisalimonas asiatica TaxID=406100 RepID=A0A1H8QQ43_9GAMM|nr:glycolate oxidase subunit GlcE [Aquisalimonas asiatica]SEO56111.1 glycolate oxidase FAD binding subunit [Aquisalimonas asiatica]